MRDLGSKWLIFALVLNSCAQIVPPVGGDKDVTPPQVLSFEPANAQTSFNSNRIVIEFDEYVQLNDIREQLVISPPLDERPKVQVKKRSVIVSWEEELMPNTTYTFDFGEGIADVNEGNVADIRYVFSTGARLDSLRMAGRVLDALSNQPVQGARVMLYEAEDDSLPLLKKPTYFSKSNKEGYFTLNYLKSDNYKLFIIKEEFGNFLYDELGEQIAFSNERVMAYPSDSLAILNSRTFYLAQEDNQPQFLTDWKVDSTGVAIIGLNRPAEDIRVSYLDGTQPDLWQHYEQGDSLRIWIKDAPSASPRKLLVYEGSEVLDTVPVPHFATFNSKGIELSCGSGPKFDARSSLVVESRIPIFPGDNARIILLEDSVQIPAVLIPDSSDIRQLQLSATYRSGRNYDLTLLPGAVVSGAQSNTDTLKCRASAYPAEYYGNFLLEVQIPPTDAQYLTQMLDQRGKVIYEFISSGDLSLDLRNLIPGNYTLRVIEDLDLNGEWTTVDYWNARQPERTFIYSQAVVIRSNWDQKLLWQIIPD